MLVEDVMTPADKVYMLEATRKLTFETILEIYKGGHTRIPVYDGSISRDAIVGILYVKDLILVDPDDAIMVRTIVGLRCFSSCNHSRQIR